MPRGALQLVITAMAGATLCACVSESRPPFPSEGSREQALRDYLQLSVGYFEEGDLANTRRHLNNLLELDPDNGEAHGIWGLVYAREGEAALADASFRRALRLDPRNSRVRNNYAAFLFGQQRYPEAHEQLEAVVRDTEYPARAQAFENLGLAALRLERPDAAASAFRRALELNPQLWRASLELAELALARNELGEANARYRAFLAVSTSLGLEQSARSLGLGLRLERALGNDTGARDYARLLGERFPTAPEYQLYLQSRDD